MTKYSIITPVYNSEKYLQKCIESVINQTYANWELIMVNDGSKDSSFSIMQEYAEKDSRIVIRTKNNEGPGLTRNLAMQLATGDYLVFLDSDDYIEPNYLEIVDKKASESSDVVFIDIYQEKPDGTLIKYEDMSRFKNLEKHDLIGMQMTGTLPWGGWRKVAKRSIITDHGMKYSEDAVGEEAIFSFDLLVYADNISFVENRLYHYVNHPQSQSKTAGEGWTITAKKMKQHLLECNLFNEYQQALNAFAYTAICGRLLSSIKTLKYTELKQEMNQRLNGFEKDFDWYIEEKYLRKEPRMILSFIRKRWYFLPVIGGKILNALK